MTKLHKIIVLMLFSATVFSQNSLLDKLKQQHSPSDKQPVTSVFKSFKFGNFETTKLVTKKHLNLIVSHRFGSIENGIEDLFGLDFATMRLQFVYGLTDKINLSVSRSTFQKFYDGGIKYEIASQKENGFPVTIVGYNSVGVNTQLDQSVFPRLEFKHRLRYANQILVSSKINNKLSVELIPTLLHDGLVEEDHQDNTQYALGFGGRYLITKRTGVIIDYGLHLNRASGSRFNNPLSIGLEIETGGHVFQLHFSNAKGMFENAFIANATGDWGEGDVFFGFNINRIFNLKTKK